MTEQKNEKRGAKNTRKTKVDAKSTSLLARGLHAENRQQLISSLYNRSINQLITDFIVELDAKNQAYYFIMEHGHFEAFRKYCLPKAVRNEKPEN